MKQSKVKRAGISKLQAAASRTAIVRSANHVEPLESRQLFSLVIDVEAAGGVKSATVDTVGQTLNLQVWATVTGNDATGSDDGIQSAAGSFLSHMTASNSVKGNFATQISSPFDAFGSADGTQQDLNGDGNIDVGSNGTDIEGYFNARAGSVRTTGGTVSGNQQKFFLAFATFTVTSLSGGQPIDIGFRPRVVSPGFYSAIWGEDGNDLTNETGTYTGGAPFVIQGTVVQPVTGSVSGNVFKDVNGNGKMDAGDTGIPKVSVYSDVNNNHAFDPGEPITTTDSSGNYTLGNLPAGDLLIRQVLPSGYAQVVPVSNMAQHVHLNAGQNSTGWNFADRPPTTTVPGSISGNVYNDFNGSSTRDPGEPNMVNVQIYLDQNKNGVLDPGELRTFTDNNGNYKFSSLAPNVTYRVREVVPAGFRVSLPFSPVASNWFYDISVGNGANVVSKPFADTQSVLIMGNVFNDINSNGVQNTGESGLSGWRVYMDLNDNGSFQTNENSKLTDSSGNFVFMSLKAGTYFVRVVPTTGYTEKAPASHVYKVTLASGGIWSTKLIFAEHKN